MEWISGRSILLILSICLLFLPGCKESHLRDTRYSKGVYHRVKSGETLTNIAQAYHIRIEELARENNIKLPYQVKEGSVLFIPGATHIVDNIIIPAKVSRAQDQVSGKAGTPKKEAATGQTAGKIKITVPPEEKVEKAPAQSPAPARIPGPLTDQAARPEKAPGREKTDTVNKTEIYDKSQEQIPFEKARFIWPAKGKVVTRFGIQPDGTYHNGIEIESDYTVPVRAAAAGKVIYSANMKDYGETVIIRHDDHYHTVYSHLGKRLVRMDERIKKGQRIALAGAGDSGGKLRFEFEVRYHNKAKNPLFFLP